MRTPPALLAALLLSAPALAQQYTCTVTGAATSTGTINATVNFSGYLKGNYDATTNPTGTRTLTSGGSTAAPRNDNISPVTGAVTGNGGSNTVPAGSLVLRWNGFSHTVEVFNLSLDMNGASPDPAVPVNAAITYPGFRAIVGGATYTYIFLTPINVPLGNATLTANTLTQTGRATATATPGTGGAWNFVMDIPAQSDANVNSTAGDSPSSLPITLHVTGTLTPGATSCTATMAFSTNQTQPVAPVAADPLNPIPFSLTPPPWPLAPSGATATADVLMVLGITGGNVVVTGNSSTPSAGPKSTLADVGKQGGLLSPDGQRDNNDFIVFIDKFFALDPLADVGVQGGIFGGDGVFDNNDFVVFIDSFFTP